MRFLAVTLAASAFGALLLASPAAADTTYTDTTGENPAAADIGTIVVSNDPAAQTVTFKVQIVNMPTVETNAEIDVLVDGDRNPATGESGFDYDFFLNDSGWGFDTWDGTQFKDAPEVASLPVTYGAGLLVVTMPLSVLGGVASGAFDFAVLTFRGDPSAPATDQAPDAAPLYTYVLAAPPPPKPTPKPKPKPTIVGSTVKIAAPAKAGRRFVVGRFSAKLSDGTSVGTSGQRCSARLGGKPLRGTGAGHCTFALPKKAKGKKLVVTVSGRDGPVALKKRLTYRVR